MEAIYEASDLVKIFNKKQSWFTTQIYRLHIIPSKEAEGTGKKHQFTFADLVKIRIFLILSEKGSLARKYAAEISQHPDVVKEVLAQRGKRTTNAYIRAIKRYGTRVDIQFDFTPSDVERNLQGEDYAFYVNLGRAVEWVENNEWVNKRERKT